MDPHPLPLPLVCPHLLQLSSFLKAAFYLQMEWSPLGEHLHFASPYRHSNLSLANSLLLRPLGKRSCWIGGRPCAHMGGVTNRPSSHLSGGGSALFMQCTDTQFHFLSGNKLVSSSHLFRKREYSQEEALLSVSTWGSCIYRRINLLAARKERWGRQPSKLSLGSLFKPQPCLPAQRTRIIPTPTATPTPNSVPTTS